MWLVFLFSKYLFHEKSTELSNWEYRWGEMREKLTDPVIGNDRQVLFVLGNLRNGSAYCRQYLGMLATQQPHYKLQPAHKRSHKFTCILLWGHGGHCEIIYNEMINLRL